MSKRKSHNDTALISSKKAEKVTEEAKVNFDIISFIYGSAKRDHTNKNI